MKTVRCSPSCLLLVASLAAGCGPSWVVVKQANPNPLLAKRGVTLEPLSWTEVSIGGKTGEADWIATRKPDERAQFQTEWEKDKSDAGQLFVAHLAERLAAQGLTVAAAPSADSFGVQAHVDMFEPGFWSPVGFANAATELHLTVNVVDAGGVQDTVKFTASIGASSFINAAVGQRLRQAAQNAADQVAAYLAGRRQK